MTVDWENNYWFVGICFFFCLGYIMSRRFSFGNMDESEDLSDHRLPDKVRKTYKYNTPKISPMERRSFWVRWLCGQRWWGWSQK
jgi:hypothetical protein